MRSILYGIFILVSLFFTYCDFKTQNVRKNKIECKNVLIKKTDNSYNLYRNGEVFRVKGAVGYKNLEILKDAGGNTINIYHKYLSKSLLDHADSLGLAVVVTLDIGRPFYGVDYSDESYCTSQRKWVERIVNKYKNHPAVLYWVIGNEIHLTKYIIPEVWKEVNVLSKLIHNLDPFHLTTTNIGALDRKQMIQVKMFTSDIDFISINAHHKNYLVKREIRNLIWGWEGPYMISEWTGPLYWHNHTTTDWGAVLEPNSTQKTDFYNHSFYLALQSDPSKCLGGFIFYWGEKQERTHTWFSLIPENKYLTQPLEVLYSNWSGTQIKNYAPRIKNISFADDIEPINIFFRKGSNKRININVNDPESDTLSLRVDLYEESDYSGKSGGDNEYRPPLIFTDSISILPKSYELKIPEKEGAYRVFINIFDRSNNVALQNIPFYVVPI